MGDRANVAIKQNVQTKDNEPVYIYFYTHWSGSDLPQIVQDALKRGQGRWGDSAYLNRIIFCEMVKDAVLEETGYGIDTSMPDNEHEIIYVDNDEMTVTIAAQTWSFKDYLTLDLETLLEDY